MPDALAFMLFMLFIGLTLVGSVVSDLLVFVETKQTRQPKRGLAELLESLVTHFVEAVMYQYTIYDTLMFMSLVLSMLFMPSIGY